MIRACNRWQFGDHTMPESISMDRNVKLFHFHKKLRGHTKMLVPARGKSKEKRHVLIVSLISLPKWEIVSTLCFHWISVAKRPLKNVV